MAESDKDKELELIKKKLKERLVIDLNLQNTKAEDIRDDAPLFGEGLGLDSLDAVEIVVLLQRHFGVEVKDMEVGRRILQSVSTLAEYVYERTHAA